MWLADLAALFAAYCTAALILLVGQHAVISSRPARRWLPLLCAISLGVLVAVMLQARYWSLVRLAHPAWFVPGIALALLLALLLPDVLRAEFAR